MKQLIITFLFLSIFFRNNAQNNQECFDNLKNAATELEFFPYISDKSVFTSANILEDAEMRISFDCINKIFNYPPDKPVYTFKDTTKDNYPLNELKKFKFKNYTGFIFHDEFSCVPKKFIGNNYLVFLDTFGKMVYFTMVHDYHFDSVTSLFSTYHSYIVNKDYIVFFESNSAQNCRVKCIINFDDQNFIRQTEFDADDNKNLDSIMREFNIQKIDYVTKTPTEINLNKLFFENVMGYIPLEMFNLRKSFLTHSWGTKVILDSVESYFLARYKISDPKDDKVKYLSVLINNLNMSGFNSSIEVYGSEQNSEGRNIETFLIATYFRSKELNDITSGKLQIDGNNLKISNDRGEKRNYKIEIH